MGTNPVIEHNTCNAFQVPEELVNIVIDDGFMILFTSHEFPIDDLVALVPEEVLSPFSDKALWEQDPIGSGILETGNSHPHT